MRIAERPRIHLIAAGSPVAQRLKGLGLGDAASFCRGLALQLGDRFEVTYDLKCLTTPEDDDHGGRTDDARRAADIEGAMRDDRTAAILSLAGGAWFVRVLRRIDFEALRRRRRRLCVFGISEMTPLVNIVARYRRCVGIHDTTPLFVLTKAGTKRSGQKQLGEFLEDVVRMIDGQPSARRLQGVLLSGRLPQRSTVRVVGGCLTLMASLMGTPFAGSVDTRGHWLALEDVNEKPERLDRMLAQLGLAGLLECAEGILLGDFHRDSNDHHDAVVELLRFHLPSRRVPIVGRCNFGHIWPAAPILLRQPLTATCRRGEVVIGA